MKQNNCKVSQANLKTTNVNKTSEFGFFQVS